MKDSQPTGGKSGGGGTDGGGAGKGKSKGKTSGKWTSKKGGEKGESREEESKKDVEAKVASTTAAPTTTEQAPSTTTSGAVGEPTTGETALVDEVTSLLRSLRAEAAVKVCFVRKVTSGGLETVLLDGGATHCLRTCTDQKEWMRAQNIRVALAEGSSVMRQCPNTKTLLTQECVQPIVPVSLVTALGYKMEWSDGSCRVVHKNRPSLPVTLSQGCPTVPLDVGMQLLKEVRAVPE